MKFFPEVIHIDITDQCNLKCRHCRGNLYPTREGYTFDTLKKRLSEIISDYHSIKWVKISGGEPLLYDRLFDLIAFLHRAGIKTILQTNGTLLSEACLNKLKNSGLTKIQLSIEGATQKINDSIRGKGTFERIVNAAKLIKKSGIPFAMRTTIMKRNINEIEGIVKLAKSVGANEVGFRRVIPVGNAASANIDISEWQYAEFLNGLNTLARKYDISVFCGDPNANSLGLNKNLLMDKSGLELGGCTIGINSFCINSGGYITPCSMINLRLGDLLKDRISDVWENNFFFKKMRNRETEGCQKCVNRNVCGGCRAISFIKYGDYFKRDPRCLMKNNFKFGNTALTVAPKRITKNICNSYLFKDKLTLQIDAGHIFNEKIDVLVLTHCHYDHIVYASEIKKRNPCCKVMCGKQDAESLSKLDKNVLLKKSKFHLEPVKIDRILNQGDIINLGNLKFSVIETPGHTKGSICLYEKNKKILITGDTWYGGFGHGNTNSPSGSEEQMACSLKKLSKLKVNLILPGHYSVISRYVET